MEDGSIRNIKLISPYDQRLGEAVKIAVEKMPNWQPGMCSGIPVPVLYTLPIIIDLK